MGSKLQLIGWAGQRLRNVLFLFAESDSAHKISSLQMPIVFQIVCLFFYCRTKLSISLINLAKMSPSRPADYRLAGHSLGENKKKTSVCWKEKATREFANVFSIGPNSLVLIIWFIPWINSSSLIEMGLSNLKINISVLVREQLCT